MNVLVVYRLSDNRIIHTREQQYGLPRIDDLEASLYDSSAFDSSSMDYLVGVTNYDDEDYDDDGILTSTAVSKYGITEGEEDKYIQDMQIIIPESSRVDHLIFDSSTGDVEESLLSASYLERELKLAVSDVDGTEKLGYTEGITGCDIYDLPDTPGSSWIEWEITKYDSDGNPMTGAGETNEIWIEISGGKLIGPRKRNLSNGSVTVRVWIPDESIKLTIIASCVDSDGEGKKVISGSHTIYLNGYET